MPLLLVADFLPQFFFQWLQQIEGDIGRLKVLLVSVRNVVHQRAERRRARDWYRLLAASDSRGKNPRQHSRRNRFCVSLYAANLPGKRDARPRCSSQEKSFVEQSRRADVSVA